MVFIKYCYKTACLACVDMPGFIFTQCLIFYVMFYFVYIYV